MSTNSKTIKLKSLFLIAFLCTLLSPIHSRIMISSPPELVEYFETKYTAQSEEIPYSVANYGDIPYEKTLTANIGIPSVLENCFYDEIDTTTESVGLFVLSERMDCTFTQKSLNAQKQGGKMAIIMDSQAQDPQRIIMIDDGRGEIVHIPTILITIQDGNKIVEMITKGLSVAMSVNFETNKREKADMDIWLSATDRSNYIFLRKLNWYYKRLSKYINLKVRYGTFSCEKCNETNCYCQNNQYCKTVQGFQKVENIGQKAIQQQLRQQLIFEWYPSLWWGYMNTFDLECVNWATADQCSEQVMKKLGIFKDIDRKVEDSFSTDYSENSLLESNQDEKMAAHILLYPTVKINDIVYRGNLQPIDVFDMLCNSIEPKPQECDLSPVIKSKGTIWKWVIIGCSAFMIFLIVLVVCARRCIRRRLSQDINSQVNQLVNQYITMYENQRFTKHGESGSHSQGIQA